MKVEKWVKNAICELPCASLSKRVLMQTICMKMSPNYMEINLLADHMAYEWFHTKTRFDKEVMASRKMAYSLFAQIPQYTFFTPQNFT